MKSHQFSPQRGVVPFVILLPILLTIALQSTLEAHALTPEKDTGNLGEIRQSILNVTQFQEIYGQGWILMAGQNAQDSDLFREKLWNESNIPDARGVFLRSSNEGRPTTEGCSEGNLGIGSYRADQFGSYNHPGTSHAGNAKFYRTVDSHNKPHEDRERNPYESRDNHQTGWDNSTRSFYIDRNDSAWTNANHTHDLAIEKSGGTETQPRNITVNTFIKVNRTPESQQTDHILSSLTNLPGQIAKNEALHQTLQALIQIEVFRALAAFQAPAQP